VTVALFLASTAYIQMSQRIGALEQQQSIQDQHIAKLQTQLDTINTRGTTGADSRLSGLETKTSILEIRLSRLETNSIK
jgi:outer membrane protein TolC